MAPFLKLPSGRYVRGQDLRGGWSAAAGQLIPTFKLACPPGTIMTLGGLDALALLDLFDRCSKPIEAATAEDLFGPGDAGDGELPPDEDPL